MADGDRLWRKTEDGHNEEFKGSRSSPSLGPETEQDTVDAICLTATAPQSSLAGGPSNQQHAVQQRAGPTPPQRSAWE